MIRDLFLRIRGLFTNRLTILGMIFVVLIFLIWSSLFSLQVTNRIEGVLYDGGTYTKEEYSASARGEIYDRYGRVLAGNEYSWSLYYDSSIDQKDLNALVLRISKLLESYGLRADLPQAIAYSETRGFYYTMDYEESAILRILYLAEIYSKSSVDLTVEEKRSTAQQAYDFMHDKLFEIDPKYSVEEALEIIRYRYAIYIQRFKTEEPIRILTQVPESMMVMVTEHSSDYPTLFFQRDQHRVYSSPEAFAHIIGYMRFISESEVPYYEERGYNASDLIGADGLESVYEEALHGTTGITELTLNSSTDVVVDTKVLQEAAAGNSIYLTIDKDLQEKAYEIVKHKVAETICSRISREAIENGYNYPAGSVLNHLIDNNWLDPDVLLDSDSSLGLAFKRVYMSTAQDLLNRLRSAVMNPDKLIRDYDEQLMTLYNTWIEIMRDYEGILSYEYQQAGSFYESYASGEKSANYFIKYCLYNNYIDLSYYGLEHEMDVEVMLNTFMDAQCSELLDNNNFQGLVYSYILENELYSSEDFIQILIEQKVLKDLDNMALRLRTHQMTAEEALIEQIMADEISPADIHMDPCSASAVITDTDTGEVLAMISYPSFDSNKITSDYSYYSSIINNQSSPMLFRAVDELRAPGSTFKLCTSIAALEEGVVTDTETVYDEYRFELANSVDKPTCMNYHGDVDIYNAIRVSCNYYFYTMGYRLCHPDEETGKFEDAPGLETLAHYATELGLATPTGIEVSETTPTTSKQDAIRSAIGQGTNAYTTANLNRYTSTVANSGKVYNLFLVDHITDNTGKVISKTQPTLDHVADVSQETFETVQEGMRMMAEGADYLPAYMEDYNMTAAGKTGTAQEDAARPDHSIFTGYINVDDPEITITMVIPFGGSSWRAITGFVELAKAYYQQE